MSVASFMRVQAEAGCVSAVQAFLRRLVVAPHGACPYTKTEDWAATGLEKRGVSPGPVAYHFAPCSDALDGLAAVTT